MGFSREQMTIEAVMEAVVVGFGGEVSLPGFEPRFLR